MANLLLIDDDADLLRDEIAHVFASPEHRVEVAHTRAEGLRRATEARPDVIVLDLRLHDQSGLDVLKQIGQTDACIPVALVNLNDALEAGSG